MEPWKLLIAVGDAAPTLRAVPAGVRALVEQADEILVVAPALPGRLDWLAGQTDKTRQLADERLAQVLGQLQEADADARGVVGSDDPMIAFEDAIAEFDPDHILIALRNRADSGWQEERLVDRVLERFGLPVTAFELDAEPG